MTQKSGKTAAGRQVEMIISQLDSLSTLPRTAAGLLSCLSEQSPDFEVLSGIIQSDPPLTAKALSIAAGQGLGDSDNGINLDWVVAQLPARVLRDAVLSVGVFDVFGVDPQTNQRRRDMAMHSLATACCAGRIAEFVLEQDRQQQAFCAGLLHDIGKTALDEVMPKSFEQMVLEARGKGVGLCEIEQEHLGLDHAVLGKRLAEKWNLPRSIVTAIWFHHAAVSALAADLPYARLAAVVSLADILARKSGLGHSGSFDNDAPTDELAQAIGLSASQIEQIQEQLPELVQRKSSLAGLESPDVAGGYCRIIHQTAAKLACENTRLAEQAAAAPAMAGRIELIKRFLGALSPQDSAADVARHLAILIRDIFSGGSVVVFVPASDGLFVESGYVDRNGRSGSAVTPLQAGQGLGAEMFESGFELVKASPGAQWLFDRLGLSMDLTSAMAAPLLTAGRSIGSALLEPPPTGIDAQLLETVCATGAAMLSLSRACIREREQAEQLAATMGRFRQMQKELADARTHNAIAEMAAGAAHELNNPLAVISGRAQLLYDQEQDPAKKQMLGQIRQRTGEISEMLSGLMVFARPGPPEKHLASVLELMERAVENTCQKHHLDAIDIEYIGLEFLPDVYIDTAQVVTALGNLLSNALQSYPGENGPVKVEGAFHKTANFVELVITDQGCGMDQAVLERAVEPFFSAKPAGRQRGMGLAYANRLLRLNGGSLALESKAGSGTTARVSLPCV